MLCKNRRNEEVDSAQKWICLFLFKFLFLGSWISYDLNDEHDIKARIKKANNAMGSLKTIWSAPEVVTHTKYLIYIAIPFNLLLGGCESWATNLDVLKKLEIFHLRCIRRILGISWDNMRDENISNQQVRKKFNNIKSVELQIAKRRLTFLGKIIRMTNDKIPARLLSAVCQGKRPLGRPNTTTRYSILKDIKKLIPEVDNIVFF